MEGNVAEARSLMDEWAVKHFPIKGEKETVNTQAPKSPAPAPTKKPLTRRELKRQRYAMLQKKIQKDFHGAAHVCSSVFGAGKLSIIANNESSLCGRSPH